MKKECDLIRDLLPLYTENLVSDYTKELVDNHLSDCEDCKKELKKLQPNSSEPPLRAAQAAETAPLSFLKKKLFFKKLQVCLCTATLMLALLTSLFAYLTSPQYLPYSEDMLTLTENTDGSITITFDDSIPHAKISFQGYQGNAALYDVEAWTTSLDSLGFYSHLNSSTITPGNGKKLCIYYIQNNASDTADILLYDSSYSFTSEGMEVLPRLVLGYYLMLAIVLWIFLTLASLVFIHHRTIHTWLVRIMLLPLSYILGHIFIMGPTTISYSVQRDFFLIVFVGLLIYCALLCMQNLYEKYKETKVSKA